MFLLNNIVNQEANFSEEKFKTGFSIYEVIRVFKGKPIFLKDNLIRLDNSLKKSNICIQAEHLNIPSKLDHYIALAHIQEGNLKYVLHFTSDKMDEYIFQIHHSYPTEIDYQQGVPTITHTAVRQNPGVKYINTDLRTLANQLIQEQKVYEILLVDQDGYITEGSRSNVFFIRNRTLYTAPLEYVLPGTSRKRVFDICNTHRIEIVEQRIDSRTLSQYEAAFLTGTSPLILPINRINNQAFNPANPLLKELMKHYFSLLS